MELNGKVAVITGGASGIGRAMAQRFGEAGVSLLLADIETDVLASTVDDFTSKGFVVDSAICDVSDRAAVTALGEQVMDRFGAVHFIANNAGVGAGGLSWEISDHDWDWVLGVDLYGVIYGVSTFVPLIIESGGGHVINTASAAGLTSVPFMAPYNVAKHGVVTLSETLFHELAMTNPEVGVTVLCPGWVKTGIAESARNRPPAAPHNAPDSNDIASIVAGLVADGLDPLDVADAVMTAVAERQFYVLTHKEWGGGVIDRAQRIVNAENPVAVMPTADAGGS